ncbi:hypothetical protein [Humisphaera borealis]|uniref:SH3 domain-containing protein n=1 Tax=Humisphaera borealis TaxID=2807512 RepID=A0A7M2X320_9BACT|nr:hypothetical protein [Humisphaera borealis]QOV92177.1 hypothetical protein IPV69_12805 [Humisphaera borealis]
MTHYSIKVAALAAIIVSAVAGCGGGSEESSAAGRKATVEYRPVTVAGGPLQKQRSGILKKVTGDWVVIDENGTEIWVPRDMVLEIRMGS